MRQILPLMAMLTACLCLAAGQESSALINKALDQKVTLVVDKNLPQVLKDIEAKTDVPLRADPVIWDLLPWGQDTKITMTVENVPLKDALGLLARRLGLQAVLRDEYIEMQPTPALRRLPQRANATELNALNLLASKPLKLDTDHPTIRQLVTAVDLKLADEKEIDLSIENNIGDAISLEQKIFVPRNATLMDALEALTKQTKATWYAWDKSIIVRTKEDLTREMLNKPLSISVGERGIDVLQLLTEISARTGVPFEYQPGVIQAIPTDSRIVHAAIENAPARRILEGIAAEKGLAYTIQDDKVYISSPASLPGRDRLLGFIRTDIGIDIAVRDSDVPPDLRDFIRYKTQKQMDRIREMMKEEGFKPTTQPAASSETP
jgi:hypothetical protein